MSYGTQLGERGSSFQYKKESISVDCVFDRQVLILTLAENCSPCSRLDGQQTYGPSFDQAQSALNKSPCIHFALLEEFTEGYRDATSAVDVEQSAHKLDSL